MDWPTASVVLGVLGTIATAFLRFVPARGNHNANGQRCATRDDVQTLLRHLHEVRAMIHELHTLLVVIDERTRRGKPHE